MSSINGDRVNGANIKPLNNLRANMSDSLKHKQFVAGNAGALCQLAACHLAAEKAADPLRHFQIIAASNVQARSLKKIFMDEGVPGMNIEIDFFDRLFEMCVSSLNNSGEYPEPFQLRSEISGIERELAVEAAIASCDLTYFDSVHKFPGFTAALLKLFNELEDAAFSEAFETLHRSSLKEKDLVALHRAYTEQFRGSLTREQHAVNVAQAIEDCARRNIPLVLPERIRLFGFHELTGLQARLLQALGLFTEIHAYSVNDVSTDPMRSILPQTPVQVVMFEGLTPAAGEHLANSHKLKIIEAPDLVSEVKEATREALLLSKQRSIDLKDMAFVVRDRTYDQLIFKKLLCSGIPFYMANAFRSIDSCAFNFLRSAVRLTSHNMRREDLLRLSEMIAPVELHFAFDRLLRQHNFTAGKETFDRVFNSSHNDAAEPVLRELRAIHTLVQQAGRNKDAKDSCAMLLQLLDTYEDKLIVRPPDDPDRDIAKSKDSEQKDQAHFLDPEVVCSSVYADLHNKAKDALRERIRKFGTLEIRSELLVGKRTLDVIWDHLSRELAAEYLPFGSFLKDGLNVLTLNQFRGLSFKAVFVLGATSRSYPTIQPQDPLLSDEQRIRLDRPEDDRHVRLALASKSVMAERTLLKQIAKQAVEHLVLSFPTHDDLHMRSFSLSYYALELAKEHTGRALTRSSLNLQKDVFRKVTKSDIFDQPPVQDLDKYDSLKTLLVSDMKNLAAYLLSSNGPFKNSICVAQGRYSAPSLTEYDGLLNVVSGSIELEKMLLKNAPKISASRLEKYAKCPFNYFMSYVLEVRPLAEPSIILELDPMKRGALFHQIMKAGSESATLEGKLFSNLTVEALQAIFEDAGRAVLEALQEQGSAGYPLLWNVRMREIQNEVSEAIAHGIFPFAESGQVPLSSSEKASEPSLFELDFQEPLVAALSPYVSKEINDELCRAFGTACLVGTVDRVDMGQDGSFVVIDYKTGKYPPSSGKLTENSLNRGTTLQVPLYSFGMAAQSPKANDIKSVQSSYGKYLYATSRGKFQAVQYGLSEIEARASELAEFLIRLSDCIEAGIFIPYDVLAGSSACKWCDQKDVCETRPKKAARAKQQDLRIQKYRDLVGADSDRQKQDGDGEHRYDDA